MHIEHCLLLHFLLKASTLARVAESKSQREKWRDPDNLNKTSIFNLNFCGLLSLLLFGARSLIWSPMVHGCDGAYVLVHVLKSSNNPKRKENLTHIWSFFLHSCLIFSGFTSPWLELNLPNYDCYAVSNLWCLNWGRLTTVWSKIRIG